MPKRVVPLIEVSGDARQRGAAYGEAARAEIRGSVEFYRDAFAASSGLDWPDVLVAARQWRALIEGSAPDLLVEMDAIAEGAGLHPDEILALNARGEIVRNHDSGFGRGRSSEPVDGCSSYALLPEVTGDGHTYCGQNWDWRAGVEATTVLLRVVQPPKPTIIMQVEAGQIGRQGANSAGIALNANGLGGRFEAGIGVPQPVLRRLILDSASLRAALQVPFDVHQHIATNLLITHRDGVAIDLETTPVAHRWGYPADGILVHGNHYQFGVPERLRETYRPSPVDSLYRVPIITRGLGLASGARDSAGVRKVIAETMSDHTGLPDSVCAHADPGRPAVRRNKTIMSSLVDLTTGEYRLAAGNPCENDYELLPWRLYDGPGGDRTTSHNNAN
ncbi:C45 family autoproteolytic acyltransferase/hydolase [Saccharopolyspora sp. 5N708]|uniref:C45 family autoproteolytic acyltransferase/hydolase n=1 Tax=Saccharopolyspora sp. 5N708 TaxID=3457424 RepID=UPI003FD67816